MLNPTFLTKLNIIRLLEAGNPVSLDAPGWGDTARACCPDCGRLTMYFKGHPHVRFEYGMSTAQPHRCGQEVLVDEHPKWLQLERVNRELDALAQTYNQDHINAVWGAGR